ncbi:MAG: hypothetical protein ACXV5D_08500 [Halobacteriota archaeon]
MANREQFEPDPFDEELVRRDMRNKCSYDYSNEDATKFIHKASAALTQVFMTFRDVVGEEEAAKWSINLDSDGLEYHEGFIHEGPIEDFYAARSVGIRATMQQRLFYYYFYAMKAPLTFPPTPQKLASSPYCVFTKVSGKYEAVRHINSVTQEELFEDVKKAFNDARA